MIEADVSKSFELSIVLKLVDILVFVPVRSSHWKSLNDLLTSNEYEIRIYFLV